MSNLQIGWIGLGLMGNPMSRRLLGGGYKVCVFNRTKEKAKPVLDAGATFCDSIAKVGEQADMVFSMISDDGALRQVALDAGNVLSTMKKGSIFIDMSTVSPAISAEVDAACKAKGIGYLRAPVSGSTVLAEGGKLTVLASGPKDAYDKAEPLFNLLGATVFHVGEGDQARYLKLMLNMMVGISSAMVGEALVFGEAGGIKWQQMLDVIKASVVCSPLVGYKLAPLGARDFKPAFKADMMGKDFDLALDAAKSANIPMPLTKQVREFWTMMHDKGKGDLDFFAYVTLMEEIAKVSPKM
jgi:3-hydroxyisobutyrate dehydrogenase-like beta-hydroxyacid dehydrogenase